MPDKRKQGYKNRFDPCKVCGKPTDSFVKFYDGRGEMGLIPCHKKCQNRLHY